MDEPKKAFSPYVPKRRLIHFALWDHGIDTEQPVTKGDLQHLYSELLHYFKGTDYPRNSESSASEDSAKPTSSAEKVPTKTEDHKITFAVVWKSIRQDPPLALFGLALLIIIPAAILGLAGVIIIAAAKWLGWW